MLDTVVISGEDVCCSVVFCTLVGMFELYVMWCELLMTSAIPCPMWSSVYECHKVECAFTSPVRTECGMFCDVLYAMSYVCVCCFVVRGCVVSRRYIDVCKCDMFSAVNVYLDHSVCINVCCGECYVVSEDCDEPTSRLVQPIVAHCCEVMYFGCFDFRGDPGCLNCNDVCICVVNKQVELHEFVLSPFMFTCSMISLTFIYLCVLVFFVAEWSLHKCVFVVFVAE